MAEFVASAGVIVRPSPRQAVFNGSGGALFGIYLRNVLLTIVTLGVYYFWAKNRTRGYLVNQCEFETDRFAWHGTGKELFLGALKLLVLAVPLVVLIYVVPVVWSSIAADMISSLTGIFAYAVVFPMAAVGARRYRLSRLSWRGIRFSFRGRVRQYFKIYAKGMTLLFLTLGFYLPYMQANIRRFVTEHTHFGATPFAFGGNGRDLLGRFALVPAAALAGMVFIGFGTFRTLRAMSGTVEGTGDITAIGSVMLVDFFAPLVLTVAAVALAYLSYAAFRHRYFWSRTTFGTARFASTMTTGKLLGFSIVNLFLLVVTLGLAFPWIVVRGVRFSLDNVRLEGYLDMQRITQDAQAASATAGTLADVFDIDFFGFDLPL